MPLRKDIIVMLSATVLTILNHGVWAGGTVYKCRDQQGSLIYQESPCAENVQSISSWAASAEPKQQENEFEKSVDGTLVIKQSRSGHYFLDGSINSKKLTFVIDTGASEVSLPRPVALSAQIYCKNQVLMQTANGSASACTTIIPRLKFGPFLMKDVTATIVPNLSQPLLGMNVLQQFRIEQDNGEMRISKRN
jgi:clan AA aspartic protease, TIGR02281 family